MEKREISLTHFIYDIDQKNWSMIGDHERFADRAPNRPMLAAERPRFYLGQKNDIKGPFLKSQILEKLNSKEITLFDFIYYDGEKDWVRIKDSAIFVGHLYPAPAAPPNLAPSKDTAKDKTESEVPVAAQGGSITVKRPRPHEKDRKVRDNQGGMEIGNGPVWMIVKGDEELGPFRYLEVLKMIQKNVISKNDKVKKTGDSGWRKISELLEFKSSVVKKIVEDGGKKVEKVFLTRKYKRSPYLGPAQITCKNKNLRGTCTSISLGGCFIEMRSDHFQLEEDVYIKIMAGTIPMVIESKGKVVSITNRTPRGVGFSFSQLTTEMISEIHKYISKYGDK